MLFAFLVLATYTAQNKVHSGITPYNRNESKMVKRDTIIHIEIIYLNFSTVVIFLNFQLTMAYNGQGFRQFSAEVVPVMKDGPLGLA
jgi:hypothetical protein